MKINRNKIGTQTCYIHQCTNKVMLMYIACLRPNLASVHCYAISILHFKFYYLYPFFDTIIPTSFNILMEMFYSLYNVIQSGSVLKPPKPPSYDHSHNNSSVVSEITHTE